MAAGGAGIVRSGVKGVSTLGKAAGEAGKVAEGAAKTGAAAGEAAKGAGAAAEGVNDAAKSAKSIGNGGTVAKVDGLAGSREAVSPRDGVVISRSGKSSIGNINSVIHDGAQGKHMPGHNNFISGRSELSSTINPQELLDGVRQGRYQVIDTGARGDPIVDFGQTIGKDAASGKLTQYGTIHSGTKGSHIVPANPIKYGK